MKRTDALDHRAKGACEQAMQAKHRMPKLRLSTTTATALERAVIIFIIGTMRAGKTKALLEFASSLKQHEYHAFRHAIDGRWGTGSIQSRAPGTQPIPCEHTDRLFSSVTQSFARRHAKYLFIDELHLFNYSDVVKTFEWCGVTGVTVVATGVATQVTTGLPFAFTQIPAEMVELTMPSCEKCELPAHADVLRAQATGQHEFVVPDEIIGDKQWCGLCRTCHAAWILEYGLPTLTETRPAAPPLANASEMPVLGRRELILQQTDDLRLRYHAPKTRELQNQAYNAYRETCAIMECAMFPLSIEKIEWFASELELRKHKHPEVYIGNLLTYAELNGQFLPQELLDHCRHLNRGLKRDAGPAERAWPLTIEILRECREEIDTPQLGRAWLTFVVCFFWLLRPGEVYALLRAEVTLYMAEREVALYIRKSKKDQEGKGATRRTRCICEQLGEDPHRADGLIICPFHAIHKLSQIAGSNALKPWERIQIGDIFNPRKPILTYVAPQTEETPFLCTPAGEPIQRRYNIAQFCELLERAGHPLHVEGRDRTTFAQHSCRRGGAQCLARGGHSISEIARWGRWSSDCVMTYVEDAQFESKRIGIKLPMISAEG